ncbi:MAG TPA: hypothetical protein VJC18_01900, partial [bacterium]|nr:hypothetical protein [bacterium]
FLEIYKSYELQALQENMLIAIPALEALLQEGDLWDFANGQGTLGGALLSFAREGFGGTYVARRVHKFQLHEAECIKRWSNSSHREQRLRKYLEGKGGLPRDIAVFDFDI